MQSTKKTVVCPMCKGEALISVQKGRPLPKKRCTRCHGKGRVPAIQTK